MTNPPYHPAGAGTPPRTATGRAAHLAEVDLGAWIGACLARLRPRGRLTLIHRADQLDVILAALAGRAGDAIVLPALARARPPRRPSGSSSPPARRRAARSRLARGLVLHEADGRFTAAAEAILRDGAPLPL